MTLDRCMVRGSVGSVGIARCAYCDDKLPTDDGVGTANIKRELLLSNSLSANALRFRIRSVIGDTYMGYRL